MALVLLATIALRWPLMANANQLLDSDEAVHALAMKHLMAGDTFFLYYPGQDYQGITEGLVGYAWTRLLGWSALAYKLGGFTFYLLFQICLWRAVALTAGRPAALAALLMSAAASPLTTQFSLSARGGHLAVPALGALATCCVFRFEATGRNGWLAAAGFTCGLAYYTYQLSIVLILPLVAYGALRSGLLGALARSGWRHGGRPQAGAIRLMDGAVVVGLGGAAAVAASGGGAMTVGGLTVSARDPLSLLRWVVPLAAIRLALCGSIWIEFLNRCRRRLAITAAGALAGAMPVVIAYIWVPPDERGANTALAGAAQVWRNAELLFSGALPALLGFGHNANDGLMVSLGQWAVGGVLLLGVALALAAVPGSLRRKAGSWAEGPQPELLWGLMLACGLCAYLASGAVVDITSMRYLVPMLLPVWGLAAIGLTRPSRWRPRFAGWLLVGLMVACQLYFSLANYRQMGVVAADGFHIRRPPYTPDRLIDYCRRNGVTAGYGTYWISYLTTFLTDEQIVLAPYRPHYQRQPPDYRQQVRRSPNPVYVFLAVDEALRQPFAARLKAAGLNPDTLFFPGFGMGIVVYHGRDRPLPHGL